MAEKRRSKKRKDEYVPPGTKLNVDKPDKEEYNIASWMRKNVPIKKTKFLNHNVEYFTGKRAVDALLESKYAKGDTPFFHSREKIVDYLHVMLEHRFFHRARKVPVTEQELKGKKKDKKKEHQESGDDEKKNKKKDKEDNKGTDDSTEGKDTTEKLEKEKRKKKVRLEMHNDQRFADSLDAYVWIYAPIPFYYWIIGTLLVLGAIGVCLFPLWPPSVRLVVYYLSVAAACFLVLIIVLAVIRVIIFSLLWILTFGKHHLWILPNLTEDVGFFPSFWPLYKYEYKGDIKSSDDNKKQKEKDSDAEEEDDEREEREENDHDRFLKEEKRNRQIDLPPKGEDFNDGEESGANGNGGVGSESETESKSSTGKDFEMVDQNELDDSQ